MKSIAVVTGASSGIGRQIAVRLGTLGYEVVVDHYRDESGAEETLWLIRTAGGDGWIHDADVGSKEEVVALFSKVEQCDGRLKLLVNNAACQTFSPLIDLPEEDWDRTIRTNLKGPFLCTQCAGHAMKETGGSIINIGSGANQVPFPGLGGYVCSKGGVEMLTKVSAVELGQYGIRVNCIAPGAIENERTKRESPDYAETWARLTPLGRVGTEQDVADIVEFLVSPQASFVTGQTLFVDGGLWTKNEWPYE